MGGRWWPGEGAGTGKIRYKGRYWKDKERSDVGCDNTGGSRSGMGGYVSERRKQDGKGSMERKENRLEERDVRGRE